MYRWKNLGGIAGKDYILEKKEDLSRILIIQQRESFELSHRNQQQELQHSPQVEIELAYNNCEQITTTRMKFEQSLLERSPFLAGTGEYYDKVFTLSRKK